MMKIESDGSMGPVTAVLDLGRERDNRNIRFLKQHDAVEGNARVRDPVQKGVIKLRVSKRQPHTVSTLSTSGAQMPRAPSWAYHSSSA